MHLYTIAAKAHQIIYFQVFVWLVVVNSITECYNWMKWQY